MNEEPRKRSGTFLRVASVLPLIPGILWLMFRGPRWAFHIFALTAIAIAAWELASMKARNSFGYRAHIIIATVGLAACIIFALPAMFMHGLLILLCVAALFSALIAPDPIESASQKIGWMIAGPIYVGATLVTVDLLHGLPNGGGWVLLSMLIAWMSDTTAYFTGRKFGKHKLYLKLSPKKTIEGALGGLGGSILSAVIAHFTFLPELPLLLGTGLAVVAGVLGQAGDLLESLLKRSTGVKDSGGILPGHGGLLDRVDALMFTAPTTWAFAIFVLGLKAV